MHNDFTLFLRGIPGGKKVFYYYTYDENDVRRGPWTTKCMNKTAARNYCNALMKKGGLLPDRTKNVTFGEFAAGFWERGSEYIQRRECRRDITDDYICGCRKMMKNQIMPFFANTPLDKIIEGDINDWLVGFKNRKIEKDGKTEIINYQNTYANTVLKTFSVMLAEAVRRGLLAVNPCEKIQKLKNDRKKLEILTVEEVRKLYPKNYTAVWGDRKIAYAANRLASLTGMRIGEILGLRGEYVFDDYIVVCGQYGDKGYKPFTKTKENRNIPLMPEMIGLLRGLMKNNGQGYVFSDNGGAKPLSDDCISRAFHSALNKIGINEAEIKRRGLSLHGWRHFLNTELQRQGLTIQQVQSVTGHKTDRMSEWYSHLDARNITDVVKAQEAIAGTMQPETKQLPHESGDGLKIVKIPVGKTA
jgi:integrase